MNKFKIREYQESDKDFLFESWNKGLRYASADNQSIPLEDYNKRFQTSFDELFTHPDLKVNIACLPDDDDVILGYAVYERRALHWVFVKSSWRLKGIAKALVPEDIESCTHLSPPGRYLAFKYKIKYNPFT